VGSGLHRLESEKVAHLGKSIAKNKLRKSRKRTSGS
jgi:hypothetical protein